MDAPRLLHELRLAPDNPAAHCGNGRWLAGAGRFASVNPATGEPIASCGRAGAAEFEAVLAAAAQAFGHWREQPAPRRGEMLRVIADELRRRKEALGSLISLETGKIKSEGEGEVQEMIDIADFAVGLSRSFGGRTLPSERPCHRLYEQWHPLGPVAVVTAFNFPAAVWAWNAFIAAACGDTVVWKPSPKASLVALAVEKIADEVALDFGHPGVFSLLLSDDAETGARLVSDARLPLVSFTGSSAVGRRVAQAVAARFGRCLLECSGNNAVIVDETADLRLAVPAIVFGAAGTAGQRCTTTRRLLVHESRVKELVRRLQRAYDKLKAGDPLDPDTLLGPLIDEEARQAFLLAVAEARSLGGEVLSGGHALPGPGFFVQPTIIRAENHWPLVQRETFGPILYLMSYREPGEAIALQNAVPQGLSSAIFTGDLRRAERFLSTAGSDCGIANVNVGTSGAEIGGAFGGEKETGGGREAGSDAWKAYMRRQTVTINWGGGLPLAQGVKFLEE